MQNNVKVDTKTIKYDINSGFLRLFAAFLIIMSALSWDVINLPAQTRESFEAMKPLTFFALFGHIGIPLFIMISGAFFLDPGKNISTESMFKKYIPKAIWVFFCWSFFYALLEQSFFSGVKAQGPIGAWHLLDMERLLKSVLLGHSHLWYMYTLIGLYLITPLLRIFTQNAKKILVDYFAFLCVFITSVVTLNAGVLHNEFLEQIVVKSNIFYQQDF